MQDKKERAREMRAQGVLCREIAATLGVSKTTIIRWTNPGYNAKNLEASRAYKAANREAMRAYDREYNATHKAACPECGGPMDRRGPGKGHTRCGECRMLAAERTAAELVALWNDGKTIPEIAAHLGWTKGHVTVCLHRYRQKGYDLPYRNRTYAGRVLAA